MVRARYDTTAGFIHWHETSGEFWWLAPFG